MHKQKKYILLGIACLLSSFFPLNINAANIINVTPGVAEISAVDGKCSFLEAVNNSVNRATFSTVPGECIGGTGDDTINVPAGDYMVGNQSYFGEVKNLVSGSNISIMGDINGGTNLINFAMLFKGSDVNFNIANLNLKSNLVESPYLYVSLSNSIITYNDMKVYNNTIFYNSGHGNESDVKNINLHDSSFALFDAMQGKNDVSDMVVLDSAVFQSNNYNNSNTSINNLTLSSSVPSSISSYNSKVKFNNLQSNGYNGVYMNSLEGGLIDIDNSFFNSSVQGLLTNLEIGSTINIVKSEFKNSEMGVYKYGSGTLNISDTLFESNKTAIYNHECISTSGGSSVYIDNSILQNNDVSITSCGHIEVENSLIESNVGLGVVNMLGTIDDHINLFKNVTFANTKGVDFQGYDLYSDIRKEENVKFINNTFNTDGPALKVAEGVKPNITLYNNIFTSTSNSAQCDLINATVTELSNYGTYNCTPKTVIPQGGIQGKNILSIDPTLSDNNNFQKSVGLGENMHVKSYKLFDSSPILDLADAYCPETDVRGVDRSNFCDIGAYEFGDVGEVVVNVFEDLNGNNVQDATETNKAGFVLTVTSANGVVRKLSTDNAGKVSFRGLGVYKIDYTQSVESALHDYSVSNNAPTKIKIDALQKTAVNTGISKIGLVSSNSSIFSSSSGSIVAASVISSVKMPKDQLQVQTENMTQNQNKPTQTVQVKRLVQTGVDGFGFVIFITFSMIISSVLFLRSRVK